MPATAVHEAKAVASPRHQQLIAAVFGLYGREHRGALPVAGLVRLLGDLGVEGAGVRSAVSRLKKRLPADWHGLMAGELFVDLHAKLAGPARRHAERALAGRAHA